MHVEGGVVWTAGMYRECTQGCIEIMVPACKNASQDSTKPGSLIIQLFGMKQIRAIQSNFQTPVWINPYILLA
jgi:hypothetical protein